MFSSFNLLVIEKKIKWVITVLFFFHSFLGCLSQARVFDFKSESFASYLRATAGTSQAKDHAFGAASGSDTSFAKDVSYNFSGEIGFLWRLKKVLSFRLGVELLQTKSIVSLPGKNSAGDELFQLDSDILVLQPTISAEIDLSSDKNSRPFLFLTGGLADATLINNYTLTPTGSTTFGSITDFTERAKSQQIGAQAGMGYEQLITDTVTIAAEAGYRYLPLPLFKMAKSTTTIAQGGVNKGDTLRNQDGSKRSVDMSGPYISLGFRFYIDFM